MLERDGVVVADVPCVFCGYNLRMQGVGGVCTECGGAVAESLGQTALRYGSGYLNRVRAGARPLAITLIAMPAIIVCTLLFRLLPVNMQSTFSRIMEILFALNLLAHAVVLWWVTATPEGSKQAKGVFLARLGALISVAGFCLMTGSEIIEGGIQMRPFRWDTIIPIISYTLLLGAPLEAYCAGQAFAPLCERAGIHWLAGWVRWITRLTGAGLAIAVLVIDVTFCLEVFGDLPSAMLMPLMGITLPCLLGSGVGLILLGVVLFRFAAAMQSVVAVSEGIENAPAEVPVPDTNVGGS